MSNTEFISHVKEYINVREHLNKLGIAEPTALTLLPVNFETATSESEFLLPTEALTIRKLLRQEELPFEDLMSESANARYVGHKSADLILPILFVSSALLAENPYLVQIALSVIANYATDFFKGMGRGKSMKMEFVVEEPHGSYKSFSFEGPPENLVDALAAIEELQNG